MHLEPKDKEEEEAFEKRVSEIRRFLNGFAKRKRHTKRTENERAGGMLAHGERAE